MFDLISAFFSLAATWLFIQKDNRAWFIGGFAALLNGWLYFQKGIFADMSLEGFYFASTCYGWYCWSSQAKKTQKKAIVKKLTRYQWGYLFLAILLLYFLIFQFLTRYTNSNIAQLDALTTALSLAAQWLMCHQLIAAWYLWFVADALYGILYWQKNLPFHTALMFIYTGLAVIGYLAWKKQDKVSWRPSHVDEKIVIKMIKNKSSL